MQSIKRIFLTLAILLFCAYPKTIFAEPTSPQEAELAVIGWLNTDSQPLGTNIGLNISEIKTTYDTNSSPIYHLVQLEPSGVVIVSGNDLVEPIIGFTNGRINTITPQTPLGTLISNDIPNRIAQSTHTAAPGGLHTFQVTKNQQKWAHLINMAYTQSQVLGMLSGYSVSDIRVEPLIKTKWSQGSICKTTDNPNGVPCYNYYTPEQYYCGCVATAMAQLIRYHQYPTQSIGRLRYSYIVDDQTEHGWTLGGDGNGGAYNWELMPFEPNCSTSQAQRQAIGALCYDAAISISTEFTAKSSAAYIYDSAGPDAKDALIEIFQYENVIIAFNANHDISPSLDEMINPNLDASLPVLIGITNDQSGHAVIVDGYGYNSNTLYHHLNMGWGGSYDSWYDLPDIDCEDTQIYNAVPVCLYNIYKSGTGEIISGRITNVYNTPIADAIVTAEGKNGPHITTTNSNGIYAFTAMPSSTTFTISVSKSGYTFTNKSVKTGHSYYNEKHGINSMGNKWQIDFTGTLIADFNSDDIVDFDDYAILASKWQSQSGDASYNPQYDINRFSEGKIDYSDIMTLAENWLTYQTNPR